MIGGSVARVRELSRGVEADVAIGASGKYGYAIVRVCSQSKEVLAALDGLKAALRNEAHNSILAAQQAEMARGRTPLGVEQRPAITAGGDS